MIGILLASMIPGVEGTMLLRRDHLEVFKSVVRPIAVAVVDQLPAPEPAPQMVFHHESVFTHQPSACNRDSNVAITDMPPTDPAGMPYPCARSHGACLGAEVRSTALDIGGQSVEANTARLTDTRDALARRPVAPVATATLAIRLAAFGAGWGRIGVHSDLLSRCATPGAGANSAPASCCPPIIPHQIRDGA
jgi:hypothetical protein